MPLHPVRALKAVQKWAVDFIGPINPLARNYKARYIITATDYLTRWANAIQLLSCIICTTGSEGRMIYPRGVFNKLVGSHHVVY